MGTYKGPTEGGSGGKRGHSNMEHWTDTKELKDSSKKRRRKEDETVADQGAEESSHGEPVDKS